MKRLLAAICVLGMLPAMSGCMLSTLLESEPEMSENGIMALTLLPTEQEETLYCGDTIQKFFRVTVEDKFDPEDIVLISKDSDIATVQYDSVQFKDYVYYTITGVGVGSTTVYFQTTDGMIRSEDIQVTVKQSVTAITLKQTEITISGSYIEPFTVEKAPYAFHISADLFEFVSEDPEVVRFEATESDGFEYQLTPLKAGETQVYIQTKDKLVQSEKLKVIVKEDKEFDRIVYITENGTKYHFRKSCAGQNAEETTLGLAMADRTPCQRCAE